MRAHRFLLLLLLAPVLGLAQSTGGPYVMKKDVIAAGGQLATGPGTVLVGTVGQSAAGLATGGTYALTGGFHALLPRPQPRDGLAPSLNAEGLSAATAIAVRPTEINSRSVRFRSMSGLSSTWRNPCGSTLLFQRT